MWMMQKFHCYICVEITSGIINHWTNLKKIAIDLCNLMHYTYTMRLHSLLDLIIIKTIVVHFMFDIRHKWYELNLSPLYGEKITNNKQKNRESNYRETSIQCTLGTPGGAGHFWLNKKCPEISLHLTR